MTGTRCTTLTRPKTTACGSLRRKNLLLGTAFLLSTNTKLLHTGNVASVVEDRLSSVLKQKYGSNVLKLAAFEATENTGISYFFLSINSPQFTGWPHSSLQKSHLLQVNFPHQYTAVFSTGCEHVLPVIRTHQVRHLRKQQQRKRSKWREVDNGRLPFVQDKTIEEIRPVHKINLARRRLTGKLQLMLWVFFFNRFIFRVG